MRGGPVAIVVTDLGYGDSGKGAVADLLCHRLGIETAYRHSGGPNSVHHVAAGATDITVSAFGSYLSPATRTHLGADFALKPHNILIEAKQIEQNAGYSPLPGLSVDPSARIVLPYHAIVGQLREIVAGDCRRGSTGQGVGEAVLDARRDPALALTVADCLDTRGLARKVARIFDAKVADAEDIAARRPGPGVANLLRCLKEDPFGEDHQSSLAALFEAVIRVDDSRSYLARAFANGRSVLCEGAHGTLIDKDYGFPPYVTRRSTTVLPILSMLDSVPAEVRVFTVGVARAIAFRHGPGPFVTEDADARLDEKHNAENPWQGKPRHGWFDAVAARYAFDCNRRPDVLAMTMLDQLSWLREPRIALRYSLPEDAPDEAGQFLALDRDDPGAAQVTGIRLAERQSTRLTALLKACRPVLTTLGERGGTGPSGDPLADPRVHAFLSHVESSKVFGHSIDILSRGPGRDDKIISDAFMRQFTGH
jgi:adenylosuccinate synthase